MRHLLLSLFLALFTALPAYADVDAYVAKTGTDSGNCQSSACKTISYTLQQNILMDVDGGNLVIHIGAGTWNESIAINGPVVNGVNNAPIPSIGSVWPSMLVLSGHTSSDTILAGDGNVCYTVASSNYAILGIRNIKLTATALSCQSELFAQMGGMINVFDNVVFGAASASQVHAENSGSSVQFWENYTIAGNAQTFAAIGQNALVLVSGGVGTLTGTPSYSNSFIFAYANGTYQTNINPTFSGSATGPQFILLSNAVIETNGATAQSLIPGNQLGRVSSGGRYRGPMHASVLSDSGLGFSGSSVVSSSSTPRAGLVILSPLDSPHADGTVDVLMPYQVIMDDGSPGQCSATFSQGGSAGWGSGAVLTTDLIDGTPTYLRINWDNPTALVSGATYQLNYTCSGD